MLGPNKHKKSISFQADALNLFTANNWKSYFDFTVTTQVSDKKKLIKLGRIFLE